MKQKFVLDINTIIFAQGYCDAKGNTDFTSATLVSLIAQNCHRIVCNNSLKKKYIENSKDLRFLRLMKHLMYNEEKCENREYLPHYPFEKDLPPDDVEIVRLAVCAQAIFVTSDLRLRAKLQELKIEEGFGLKVEDSLTAQSQARNVTS